jgi:hypothetical protein
VSRTLAAALLLLGCGGAPIRVAEPIPADDGLLGAGLHAPADWPSSPWFVEQLLPFAEGVSLRPCAADGPGDARRAFRYGEDGRLLRRARLDGGASPRLFERFCLPPPAADRTFAYGADGLLEAARSTFDETLVERYRWRGGRLEGLDAEEGAREMRLSRDAEGRVFGVRETFNFQGGDQETSLAWEAGRVTTLRTFVDRGDGDSTVTFTYRYDEGRLAGWDRVLEQVDADGEEAVERFAYALTYVDGRLATCQGPGFRVTYRFDDAGRLLERRSASPAGDTSIVYRYECNISTDDSTVTAE